MYPDVGYSQSIFTYYFKNIIWPTSLNKMTIVHGTDNSLKDKEPIFGLSALGENIQLQFKRSWNLSPVNNSQANLIRFMSSQPIGEKIILIKKLQENRSILNHIKHIQKFYNKMISLTTNPPTPDHIGDILKSPLRT